jgi:hypothetical protein
MAKRVVKSGLLGIIAATPLLIGSTCGMPGPVTPDVQDLIDTVGRATETQPPRFAKGTPVLVGAGYISSDKPTFVSTLEDPGFLKVGLRSDVGRVFADCATFLKFDLGDEYHGLTLTKASLRMMPARTCRGYPDNSFCMTTSTVADRWDDRNLNWNNAPGVGKVLAVSNFAGCPPGEGYLEFNLIPDEESKRTIQEWLNNSDSNEGLRVNGFYSPGAECSEGFEFDFSGRVFPPELYIEADNINHI